MASARSRLFAAVHDGTPGDLAFYRTMCEGARSVLELGCGHGRVLEALLDRVPRLVGLDLDDELLALASERLEGHDGASLALVQGDMRTFELGERFDRVLIPHSGLFCLLDDDALQACLERVQRHLARDGMLALDAYEADAFHEQADPDDLADDEHVFVKAVELDGQRYEVFERSTWDREHQRIDATYVHVPEGGGPAVEETIRQRYLRRDQLLQALARAGLQPIETRSSFASGQDESLIVIARRGDHSTGT